MKKTITAILAIIMLIASMSISAFAAETAENTLDISEEAVYERLIALKDKYPAGTKATNCAGFAYVIQSEIFGKTVEHKDFNNFVYYSSSAPRQHTDFNTLRVGDILRINNDTHSIVVVKIDAKNDSLCYVDGNANGKVRWDSYCSLSAVLKSATCVRTRYPEDGATTVTVTTPATTATMATAPVTVENTLDLSEEAVYERMIAMQKQYPEGKKWTNANKDKYGNGGCYAFANIIQEAAFAGLPTRRLTNFDDIKVGDHIRVSNTHSAIVLRIDVENDTIYTAEGNVGGKISWTTESYTLSTLNTHAIYVITRYPEDGATTATVTAPAATTMPAATVQTPAQTVTETKPATTTNASEFVIVNSSTADKMIVKITNGKAYSNINITTAGSGSGSLNGLTYTKAKGSNDIVVTYNGVTKTVSPGETVTIGK